MKGEATVRCWECEEILAAMTRGQRAPEEDAELPWAVAAHLAGCAPCRDFREQSAAVAVTLAAWEAPAAAAPTRAACVAALAERFARRAPDPALAPQERRDSLRELAARASRHPGLIGVLGAAASVSGVLAAPTWVQQVAIGWAAAAAIFASMVLLYHNRPLLAGGDPR